MALAAHDGTVELVVADSGPGIDPGTDPGTDPRTHAGRPARPGTTGLGLDIVARSAAAAGGSVAVDTGSAGTRVTVRLPLLAAAGSEEDAGSR